MRRPIPPEPGSSVYVLLKTSDREALIWPRPALTAKAGWLHDAPGVGGMPPRSSPRSAAGWPSGPSMTGWWPRPSRMRGRVEGRGGSAHADRRTGAGPDEPADGFPGPLTRAHRAGAPCHHHDWVAEVERPTRSGPFRSAAAARPTTKAIPAEPARAAPPHPPCDGRHDRPGALGSPPRTETPRTDRTPTARHGSPWTLPDPARGEGDPLRGSHTGRDGPAPPQDLQAPRRPTGRTGGPALRAQPSPRFPVVQPSKSTCV